MIEQPSHDELDDAVPGGTRPAFADNYASKYRKLVAQLAPQDREQVLAALPSNISHETVYHIVRSRVTSIQNRDRARAREVTRRQVGLDRITVQVPKTLRAAFEKSFEEFKTVHAEIWPTTKAKR